AQVLNPEQISLNIFQPLPATDAAQLLKKNGVIIQENCWINMYNFYYKSMINSTYLKRDQINHFKRKIDLYFITKFVKKGIYEKKIKFLKDLMNFFLFLKLNYGFQLHDAYKYTLRRYIYEKNIIYKNY
ncbi:MAG: hypothetical protein ACTSYB_02080, partial [Candidatus Helarchaeota archaeon]